MLIVLWEYLKEYRPKGLFVTFKGTGRAVQDTFKLIVKKNGFKKRITIHMVRHCFATYWLNEGKNIYEIKRFLGHVGSSTTNDKRCIA